MHKDRTFLALCVGLLLFILIANFRPKPVAVTVLPLSYNPIFESNPVSERFWVMKAQAPTHFDMIAMGDSRIYRGLSPQAMQTILQGQRILNFGFSGGGLNPEMYSAAELRLDSNSHQKSILFGVSPQTLCPRTEANDHFLQEMRRPPDYIFLHLYWMPLVNLFEPVHLSDLSNPVFQDKSQDQEGYYLEFHDDGWVASWTIPEYPDSQIDSYRSIFSTTQVSPRLVQDLLDQTQQWVAQGIKVYAYRPPTSQAMADLENQVSGFDEIDFSARFEAAGGVWFSIPLALYHSYDGSHLVKASAVQLSVDIARLIKQSEGH
jgi:hypothetical protein